MYQYIGNGFFFFFCFNIMYVPFLCAPKSKAAFGMYCISYWIFICSHELCSKALDLKCCVIHNGRWANQHGARYSIGVLVNVRCTKLYLKYMYRICGDHSEHTLCVSISIAQCSNTWCFCRLHFIREFHDKLALQCILDV